MKPILDLVALEVIDPRTSEGGIHLVALEAADPRVTFAVVSEVGPGRATPEGEHLELGMQPGDVVALNSNHVKQALPLKVNGKSLIFLPQSVVLCVFGEGDEVAGLTLTQPSLVEVQ